MTVSSAEKPRHTLIGKSSPPVRKETQIELPVLRLSKNDDTSGRNVASASHRTVER